MVIPSIPAKWWLLVLVNKAALLVMKIILDLASMSHPECAKVIGIAPDSKFDANLEQEMTSFILLDPTTAVYLHK